MKISVDKQHAVEPRSPRAIVAYNNHDEGGLTGVSEMMQ